MGLHFQKFEDASYAIFPQQEDQGVQKIELKPGSSGSSCIDEEEKQERLVSLEKKLSMQKGYSTALAQTISGKVSDEATGEGVPGVTVIVQGTGNGTITDIEGKYSLSVEEKSSLVFSFVG